MAIRYVEAVFRLHGITATECVILAYLANRANEQGLCWPTRSTIAGAVHLHAETVKAQLVGLADQARAGGPLLSKVNRLDGGRIVSADIQLLFAPVAHDAHGRGNMAPVPGGSRSPTKRRGAQASIPGLGESSVSEGGAPRTPEIETSGDRPQDTSRTPKPPGGASATKSVPQEITDAAKRMKARAPGRAHKRSIPSLIVKALMNAAGRGETNLALIEAALVAYYTDDKNARQDAEYASAVQVMINEDRWREWIPDGALAANDAPLAARAPGATIAFAVPDNVQRSWMADWVSREPDLREGFWRHTRGPCPGQPGCRVSDEVMLAFGVDPWRPPVGADRAISSS